MSGRRGIAWIYLLGCLPLLLLLHTVDRDAVSVPFMDDWQFVSLVAAVHHGHIPWHELAAPHDEHRLLLPRILIAGTLILSHGNYRVQCFLSVAVVAVLSAALLFLLRRSFGRGPRTAWLWLLANLIVFSPIQWQNWLWPMQFAYLLPFMFVGLCLAVFYSDLAAGTRMALCHACAWAASFSFINGLLLWPVMVPALLRDGRWSSQRARRLHTGLWLAGGVLVAFLYFHGLLNNTADEGYRPGPRGVPMTVSTLHLLEAHPLLGVGRIVLFAITMFGNAASRGFPLGEDVVLAALFGTLLCGAFVGAWIAARRRGQLEGACFAWPVLGLHAFATAALVSGGRLWGGVEWPLTPRYTTFGSFCLLGAVMLPALLVARRGGVSGPWRDRALVAVGAVALTLGVNWSYGLDRMHDWRDTRLMSRALIHFTRELHVPISWAGGRAEFIHHAVLTLDELGYWHPPLARTLRLDQFTISPHPLSHGQNFFRASQPASNGFVTVRGHVHAGARAPQLVLITSRDREGKREIRAIAPVFSPPFWRYEGHSWDTMFLATLEPRKSDFGSFECVVRPRDVPPGEERRLEVWTLDFDRMRVHQVQGHFEVPEMIPAAS